MALLRRFIPWVRLIVLATVLASAHAEDFDGVLPRIPPVGPEAAPGTFRVREGFRLEPLAIEPMVADPVCAAFDADGRLYVAEMRGYPFPEKEPTGNVRRLEDADGDGTFETSTIFVPGLSWPTSVLPYDGGVFIAVAPDILYARDDDGDGKADVRKVVFTGFGTQNVQQLVNGLCWGLDGWVYGASANNGGEIRNPSRPEAAPVAIRGRDFRFKPDGSAFEAISGGGQFGHVFDDWGRRFACNNRLHIRQIVLPSHDLRRNPALVVPSVIADIAADGNEAPVYRISPPEPWRVARSRQYEEKARADPVYARRLPNAERHPAGFFSSASGITLYRGSAFPAEYRGNAFVCDVAGNLVHRKVLTPQGAIFRAERAEPGRRAEFLASTDTWSRPVNLANTPDGTLLVLDMYRETIEHPLSIPEDIKRHVDLTSGKDQGRIYHILPDGFKRRSPPRLGHAKTLDLVVHLADPDAWWRETSQRLLIERRDASALPLLRALATARPTALARLHALWTLHDLGGLPDEVLEAAFRDPEPGVRENAARLAEGRLDASEPLRHAVLLLADDPDAMVRFQAALSLGFVADPAAVGALAAIGTRDAADPWTRWAVLSSVAGRAPALIETLATRPGLLNSSDGRTWLEELAVLVGAGGSAADRERLLESYTRPDSDPGQAGAVVVGLGRGLQRTRGSVKAMLDGSASARIAPLIDKAARTAADDGPAGPRIDAIRLIGLAAPGMALSVLPDLLDARVQSSVAIEALRALADLPDPRVGPVVAAHWKALSPTLRREAAEVLFARPERVAALLDALGAGTIAVADLDPARRKQLVDDRDPKVRERATRLVGNEENSDRRALLADYARALENPGDRARGRDVFRQSCATCHRAEGQGAEVGPNLATVANKSPGDLLVHILDPNREVAPQFINYVVATRDGPPRLGRDRRGIGHGRDPEACRGRDRGRPPRPHRGDQLHRPLVHARRIGERARPQAGRRCHRLPR